MTGRGWGRCETLSRALLEEAVFRWERVRVVASAMPVLCFVPVVRVIAFTQLSLPVSLSLPSAVLVLLVFAVAIPPFPSVVLPASWKLSDIKR